MSGRLALLLGACWLLALGAQAQEAERPLGDVARQRPSAKAHRVYSNDDESFRPGFVRLTGGNCSDVPCPVFTAQLPVSVQEPDFFCRWYTVALPVRPAKGEQKAKERNLLIAFLPAYKDASLQAAEMEFLDNSPPYVSLPAKAQKLYSSSATVDGWDAELLHFALERTLGRMQGVAIFVSAPNQVVGITCFYNDADFADADPICKAIVDSVQMRVPGYAPPSSSEEDDDEDP